MDTQYVTISLTKDILYKVKILAIERQTSPSGLLAQTLEDRITTEDAYEYARRNHLALLERGFDLGTEGRILSHREELHGC